MKLDDTVLSLHGVGTAQRDKLKRLGITTIQELLTLLPRRWDDFTHPMPIDFARLGETAIVRGKLSDVTLERTPRRFMAIVRAMLTDESGSIGLSWFNQPFLVPTLKQLEEVTIMGKVVRDRTHGIVISVYELEREGGILPVYPETQGLTSKQLRRWIAQALPLLDALPDPLPPEIRSEENLSPLGIAYAALHQPQSQADVRKGRERIAFDELLRIALNVVTQRQALTKVLGIPLKVDIALIQKFVQALPFTLTPDQKKAAWQILQDLQKPRPMNRLLNGEVGSGKTVVGALAIIAVAANKMQTAWLAPTEILAHQHAATLQKLFKNFGVSVGLITGSTALLNEKRATREKAITADVVIGTHALLNEKLTIARLGLLIVDEQHRFGVRQRAALKGVRADEAVPHLLTLSATPIPRTLALALYGDLDVSVIKTKPAERKAVKTEIISDLRRSNGYELIRREVAAGHQAYVICPLVEESARGETLFNYDSPKAAKAEFERLKKEVFADLTLGLVHGALAGKEKTRQMEEFKAGRTQILVATSVVEVGVDVGNATVIMIEGADRFGLAQLHQLRGRVGRSQHQAYCVLMAEHPSDKAQERLRVFAATDDGFLLAEKDLALRGPGEMYGTAQSGLPDLKMASLTNRELIARTRAVAEKIVAEGIERYPQLAALVNTTSVHLE